MLESHLDDVFRRWRPQTSRCLQEVGMDNVVCAGKGLKCHVSVVVPVIKGQLGRRGFGPL